MKKEGIKYTAKVINYFSMCCYRLRVAKSKSSGILQILTNISSIKEA